MLATGDVREDAVVHLDELVPGALIAEGGEGRVFEVEVRPQHGRAAGRGVELHAEATSLVYKQFRDPLPTTWLMPAICFPFGLEPQLAARVRSASAWPVAVVVGEDPSVAQGTLMPRAPGAFWLQHREGRPRLATLSYLTSDPDRITVAYGTVMPAPGTPERVGIVYALARLLDAWQQHGAGGAPAPASARSLGWGAQAGQHPGAGGAPAMVVHGDLSAKNVLWSLDPVPAVYVLDCDGAYVLDCDGAAVLAPEGLGAGRAKDWEHEGSAGSGPDAALGRSRARTPNWDDPAQDPCAPPSLSADRYALGLAFLRVVGAAHFPLQARQRAGEKISIDLEVPRSWRRLPDMPRLWELCERSLSVAGAADRPSPAEWAAELEMLLGAMGSAGLAGRVRALQGDPRPSAAGTAGHDLSALSTSRSFHFAASSSSGGSQRALVTVPDVEVRPLVRHRVASSWALVNAAGQPAPQSAGEGLAGIGLASGVGLGQFLRRVGRAWVGAHRLAFGLLRSRGRRGDGLRRLARALVVDLAGACLVLFLVGMIVSPWIGL